MSFFVKSRILKDKHFFASIKNAWLHYFLLKEILLNKNNISKNVSLDIADYKLVS